MSESHPDPESDLYDPAILEEPDQADPDLPEAEGDTEVDDDQGGQSDQAPLPRDSRESPEPRRGRASDTIRDLRGQLQESRKRHDELERQIQAIRTAPPQISAEQRALQEQQEQERLALMAPHEQVNYLFAKQRNEFQAQMRAQEHRFADQADRGSFEALQARDPMARRYADEVERLVREQAANGFTVKREMVLDYVVGRSMRAKATAEGNKQRARGAARVADQTVRPGGRGGDIRGEPRRGGGGDDIAALERRLRDVPF